MNDALLDLLKPAPEAFFEKLGNTDNVDYIFFSVPYDKTSSYRSGSRFAPTSIRKATHYMESYSERTELDWENLSLSDVGDLEVEIFTDSMLEKIEKICNELSKTNKIPVMLGGEHTISLGAVNALRPEAIVVFDAHLDLRDTLFEQKICHATWLRRSFEKNPAKIVVLGARALSKEEIVYAKSNNIEFIPALDIKKNGVAWVTKILEKSLKGVKSIYLSIDVDALDPSEAPAVGNPCPEGLSTTELLDIVASLTKYKLCGIDLTEVCPQFDSGYTSILAAYILLESLYSFELTKTKII